MRAKPEVIDLDLQKLETLLERIQAHLGEDVARPFRELLSGYAQLMEILSKKDLSMRRLQQLLFGAKTEQTKSVLGALPASIDSAVSALEAGTIRGEQGEQDNQAPRRPRPGHGRHGADAYSGCTKVSVSHGWLRVGDACPHCAYGKVYAQSTPRRLVRLVGQAPVGGTVYEL